MLPLGAAIAAHEATDHRLPPLNRERDAGPEEDDQRPAATGAVSQRGR